MDAPDEPAADQLRLVGEVPFPAAVDEGAALEGRPSCREPAEDLEADPLEGAATVDRGTGTEASLGSHATGVQDRAAALPEMAPVELRPLNHQVDAGEPHLHPGHLRVEEVQLLKGVPQHRRDAIQSGHWPPDQRARHGRAAGFSRGRLTPPPRRFPVHGLMVAEQPPPSCDGQRTERDDAACPARLGRRRFVPVKASRVV